MPFHPPIPEKKQPGQTASLFRLWAEAEKLMQIALVLPCSAFIGWLGGAWLDHIFHQKWISLVGIVFGGASGLIYVIRLAMDASKDPALQDKDEDGSGDGGAGKTQ
jgi:F0F1-type ATP synthase assembly protein I